MIPKIIHQTWKTEKIPAEFQALSEKWKTLHPEWEYRLWTDDDNRDFIADRYPRFLPVYDAYPYPIQKADAIRYFILYTYGGVYIDLDFVPQKNIEPLVKDAECAFALEPPINCERHKVEKLISNAFMAAQPGHPFFETIIHDLETYKALEEPGPDLVLKTTGPLAMNRVYDHYGDKEDITLIPSRFLCPIDYVEASFWPSPHLEKKTEDAYAVHLFEGRWWKNLSIASSVSPKPSKMRVDIERLLATGEIEGAEGRLDHRLPSIRKTVELLDESLPKVMVETGCQWSGLLHGDCMSTSIFGALAKKYNAILYTVDISLKHIEKCRQFSEEYSEYIRYIHGDSLEMLKGFDQEIDFLYLDSYDFRPGFEEQSRLHQLNEIKLAYQKLSSQAVVLLDDAYVQIWFDYSLNDVDVQGKTYYSHKFLMDHKAQCIVDIPNYQRLYKIAK